MFFGSEENAATARSHYRLLNPIAEFYVNRQFSIFPVFSRTFVNHFQVVFGRLFKTRYCVTVYLNSVILFHFFFFFTWKWMISSHARIVVVIVSCYNSVAFIIVYTDNRQTHAISSASRPSGKVPAPPLQRLNCFSLWTTLGFGLKS